MTGNNNPTPEMLLRVDTGCKDKDGNPLYLGDRVLYRKEGPHTKREYWNPEYEIIWDAPSFTLKHVGGGKDAGSHDFILKHGGSNGDLLLISRGPHYPSPETHVKAEPDYCYNPEDWEYTRSWDDRNEVHGYGDAFKIGEPMRVCTLVKGPDKWVADVPVEWDEAGDVINTEVKWFDTEAEALAALATEGK